MIVSQTTYFFEFFSEFPDKKSGKDEQYAGSIPNYDFWVIETKQTGNQINHWQSAIQPVR